MRLAQPLDHLGITGPNWSPQADHTEIVALSAARLVGHIGGTINPKLVPLVVHIERARTIDLNQLPIVARIVTQKKAVVSRTFEEDGKNPRMNLDLGDRTEKILGECLQRQPDDAVDRLVDDQIVENIDHRGGNSNMCSN